MQHSLGKQDENFVFLLNLLERTNADVRRHSSDELNPNPKRLHAARAVSQESRCDGGLQSERSTQD